MIQGDVVTVDYVRDNGGNDFLIPRIEFLRTKNGAGTTVKTFHDARLAETVSYIGAAIGVCGCINMEFICHEGDYYLIDINPRFSAGIAFSHLAGYDMVTSHFNCFTGKDILPAKDYGDLLMCKHYNEEVLEEI
jgi:carbamoyl-phosphate synthase large subunit